MSTIDTLLYRPLKSGTAYSGLIPAYIGTDHKFDKNSDNSTTYDTLRFMAQWSEKYAYQMKRIAPLLRGKSIEETANNIYQFLYNHFQYKLDGELQNLYSPSAAWHFRKTGFDCKTYSILASTILQNLGITHAFRMVQQAGIMPGEWSHVYVVVPNGEKHAIIDATTHNNKEVSFTKKHDYTMKHRGLASPYINGLGCACQGKAITRNGLGSPSVLENTINNFHDFLNELETKGVPREITNRMLDLVKWNVQNGIDPNMREIITKAFLAKSQGLGAIEPLSTLQSQGLTYSTAPTGGTITTMQNIASGPGGWTSELTKGFSIDGKPLTEIVGSVKAGVTGVVTGDTGAILKSITSFINIDKTFGAVFANGFNLSCWGSSHTPAETKGWAEKDIPSVYAQTLGNGVTETNLYNFIDAMNWLYTQSRDWGAKMRDCSQKALYNYGDAAQKAKNEVLDKLKLVVNVTPLPSVSVNRKMPYTFSHQNYNVYDKPYTSERFTLTPFPTAQPTQTVITNANGTQTVVNSPTPTPKKSSSLLLPLLAAGGLAIKLLI